MTFKLQNDPPKKTEQYDNTTGTQKKLFAGMDCCNGQLDLFQTDGEPDEDNQME